MLFEKFIDRVFEKYFLMLKHENEKKISEYRANLENSNYITKACFDTELEVYKELSLAFSSMVINVRALAEPTELHPQDDSVKNELAKVSIENAQLILNKNSFFILQKIYEEFFKLWSLCYNQRLFFECYYIDSKTNTNPALRDKIFEEQVDCATRSKLIKDSFNELSSSVRNYFNSLIIYTP
jgi:hypothetical protein